MPAIQIRNVPEAAHAKLKARAAAERKSLSEYALAELLRSAEAPTLEEVFARIDQLTETYGVAEEIDPAQIVAIVHEGRAER